MASKGIHISKECDIWYCSLIELIPKSGMNKLIEVIKADSFQELMVEIGNKNWIDILNKNK